MSEERSAAWGGVALFHDDLHSHPLGLRLAGGGHARAVGAVLVDDGDAQVLGRLLEALLRKGGDVLHGQCPEGAARGLGPERVLEVPVLEHRVRDGGGDPQKLLLPVHALRDRHGVRARVDAGEDVHVLGVEEPLRLIDGDVGLGLRIRVHAHDLVLAQHAALVVGPVDGELGPAVVEERARRRERPAEVEDQADLDGLLLTDRHARPRQAQAEGGGENDHGDEAETRHGGPPGR